MQKLQTNKWKIKNATYWKLSGRATLIKFAEYHPLPSIFTLRFINCSEIYFFNYLQSKSHTKTVISNTVDFPSRWLQNCDKVNLWNGTFFKSNFITKIFGNVNKTKKFIPGNKKNELQTPLQEYRDTSWYQLE